MAGYKLNTGSANLRQASSDAAITATSTNVNTGVIQAGGSDGSKLNTTGKQTETLQDKYGSQLVVNANATGVGRSTGDVVEFDTSYTMSLEDVSVGSVERPKINGTKTVKVIQVESAVRAGHWNIFTGQWDVAPTGVNNFGDFGTDQEIATSSNGRGLKGQFTYHTQSRVINDDYDPYNG